jgi:hypothetical protein
VVLKMNNSIDLLKISQALENVYGMLQQEHLGETAGLRQLEDAKDDWKQAFTYAMSITVK